MKTYIAKKEDIKKKWYLLDADGQVLGRFASRIATILRGKDKVEFAPHIDVGDEVIVINAVKIKITGKNKPKQKLYKRFSAYPDGLKQETLERMMVRRPEYVIRHAVSGMLPKNKFRHKLLKKLRVYAGAEHPHAAQSPEALKLN